MQPTSLALVWPLWRRHRWGLTLSLGYLTCVAITASVLPMAMLGPKTVNAILVPLMIPLVGLPTYLISIFSFGYEDDVNMRESCFPRSLFRLPVSTEALFGWHAAYGAAAATLVWLVPAWFILRPWLALWDVTVPLWWPAMLGVATQAWFQGVLWRPMGLPGMRIVLIALIIPAEVAVAEYCVLAGYSERFLVILFACVAVSGWLVGYAGIKKGRRGDAPHWQITSQWLRRLLVWRARKGEPFMNAVRAQVWFEWRRTGLALPVMTGLVLPFALLPLVFGQNDAIPTWRTLLGALGLPVLLAGLAGTTVSGKNAWVKDYYGVAPSTASLPMSTAAMVGAKLKAAAISTLATWVLLVLMTFLAMILTGTLDEVPEWWQRGLARYSAAELVTFIGAAGVMLVVWTWKRMVDSLFLGLTGRKWVIQGSIFAGMATVVVIVLIATWVKNDPDVLENARLLLPWLLGVFVCCRLAVGIWAVQGLRKRQLVRWGTIVGWSFAWVLLAGTVIGMLIWALPREWAPIYYVVLAIVFMLPMVRLAATPLALAWNRHR